MAKTKISICLRGKCFQTKWLTPCYNIFIQGKKLKCQKSGKELNPTVSFKVKEIFVAQYDDQENMRFARIKLSGSTSSIKVISVGDINP